MFNKHPYRYNIKRSRAVYNSKTSFDSQSTFSSSIYNMSLTDRCSANIFSQKSILTRKAYDKLYNIDKKISKKVKLDNMTSRVSIRQ